MAFKEVRRLEMEVLESVPALLPMPSVSISQFYGIEVDDFAHEIAMLSLWLAEHQMNQEFLNAWANGCLPCRSAPMSTSCWATPCA